MNNFVTNLLLIFSLLIFIVTFVKVFVSPLQYAKTEWDIITAGTIGLINVLVVFLFATVFLYIVSVIDIHILPAESIKIERHIYGLIMSLTTFIFSFEVEKSTSNYFVNRGFIGPKD